MTVNSALITLSTSPRLIATGGGATLQDPNLCLISEATADIFVGGVGVTPADGTRVIAAVGFLSIPLHPGDFLYAVAVSGTPTLRVFTNRMGFVAP